MTDVAREKYIRLMAEIEGIEIKLELSSDVNGPEIKELKRQLANKRSELARISDGCGKGHSL